MVSMDNPYGRITNADLESQRIFDKRWGPLIEAVYACM